MSVSAEAQRGSGTARLITLAGAFLQRLKAAALERGGRGSSRHMVLLESLSLGNRRQLFLVACDDHHFLVGAGPDRVGTVVALPQSMTDAVPLQAPLQAETQQPSSTRVPAIHQRPEWMRDRSMGANGLQLVKREAALPSVEAGRTQWS